MQMTASCKNTRDTVSCREVQCLSPKRRQSSDFWQDSKLVRNATAWCNNAKFLMRTGQRHLETEGSLAFAFSDKPEGARVNEWPFGLACP